MITKKINELEGIILTPLKIIPGEKGSVLHAMKKIDPGFSGFGEAYFSTVNKGEVKGWKKHKEMTLNLIVISGNIKFIAYDDRNQSKTKGEFGSVELSRENYYRLTVPPQIWLSFKGIAEENTLLNLANLLHDPDEAINVKMEEFPVEEDESELVNYSNQSSEIGFFEESISQLVSKSKEIRDIEKKISNLNSEIEKKENEIVSLFLPDLKKIYSRWKPEIGEQVVQLRLNLTPFGMQFLRVVEIYKSWVITACSMKRDVKISHRIDLEIDEYENPVIIIPMNIFEEAFSNMKFNIIEDYKSEFTEEHKKWSVNLG